MLQGSCRPPGEYLEENRGQEHLTMTLDISTPFSLGYKSSDTWEIAVKMKGINFCLRL